MSYEINKENKGNYLLYQLSGYMDVGKYLEEEDPFVDMVEDCLEQKVPAVLLDSRELEIKITFMQIFQIASNLRTLTSNSIKMAILAKDTQIDRIFETVARNRNAKVRVFTDPKKAEEWLD